MTNPLQRSPESQILLTPLLLEHKIRELSVPDPFSQTLLMLQRDPSFDPALLEQIHSPEILCQLERKAPLRTYRDITLDPQHFLFTRIHSLIHTLQTTSFPSTAQTPVNLLIQTYQTYIDSICQTTGKARCRLLKGSAQLLGLSEMSFQLPHKTARHLASYDRYGQMARANTFGASAVSSLNGVHFKREHQNSLAPGMEYASDRFNVRFFGQGSTPSTLFKIQNIWVQDPFDTPSLKHPVRKSIVIAQTQGISPAQYFTQHPDHKHAYPFKEKRIHEIVQAAYTIEGTNLWTHLKQGNPLVLGPNSFTSLCLFGLSTSISDGRADNFMLTLDHRLIGIDNDHCFQPLFTRNPDGTHSLNFRFVLFFFPHMNTPLDPVFCQRFQKLPLELLFLEWLHDLHTKNREYQALAQKGFTLDELQNIQLPIQLTLSSLLRSYHTLKRAQAYMLVHPHATHWDLIIHINSPLATIYQTLLNEAGSLIEAQTRLFDQEHPILWETYSPDSSPLMLSDKKEDPLTLLLQWIQTLSFPDPEAQERFLENLLLTFPDLDSLALHCSLDNTSFVRIFSKGKLKTLTLIRFPNLTPSGLKTLLHHHPALHLILGLPPFPPKACAQFIQESWTDHALSILFKKPLPCTQDTVQSILYQALEEESLYWAEVSLRLGARCDGSDDTGTLLHRCIHQSPSVLSFLLRAGISPHTKNKDGLTPLHWAFKGTPQNIPVLLEAGADLEAQDRNGRTPLHHAVLQGNLPIALALLHGANLHALTREKETVFHIASIKGHSLLLKQLLHREANPSAILNQGDHDGKTPLHHAVWMDPKPHIVGILLRKGASPHACNHYNYTPLHWAAKHGHLESLELLLKKSADPSAVNDNGDTPIDLALRWGQDEIVRALIHPEKKPPKTVPTSQERNDPEGYYYLQFETHFEHSRTEEMIFYLEKMSAIHFEKGDYIRAAHLLNAALATAETHRLNPAYCKSFFNRLERLEGLLLEQLFNQKTPAEHRGYLEKRRLFLKETRQQARELFQNDTSPEGVQAFLTEKAEHFLCTLFQACIDLTQQTPPTAYAILALGSFARKEMAPYSDIEFAFLLDKATPEALTYFRNLSRLLELCFINLGETKFDLLRPKRTETGWTEAQSLVPSGFSMDIGGLSPLGKEGVYELIKTPQQLAAHQDPAWNSSEGEIILVNALTQARGIWGEKRLIDAYQKALSQWLNKKISTSRFKSTRLRKSRALELLRGHIQDFQPWLTEDRATLRAFDIKRDFYRPIQMSISGLLLYHGLDACHTFQGIELLEREGILSSEGTNNLYKTLRKALRFRLQVHFFYQTEKEIVYLPHEEDDPDNENLFHLQDNTLLLDFYRTLLPFHKAVQQFLQDKKPLKDSFWDLTLGSISTQDEDNLQYRDAATAYAQHWALHPDDPDALKHIGRIRLQLGEAKKALEYNQERLKLLKKQHGDEPHPDVTTTLYNLGIAYSHLGEYKNALSYYLQALEMFKRVHGNASHPSVAATLTGLGKAYNDLGEYKNALSYHLQALEMFKRVHGNASHPSVAATLDNIGQSYMDLGKYKNALSYHLQALKIIKRVHGNASRPSVAATLNNLGNAYGKLGEYKNALSYYLQTLDMIKRVFGDDPHPSVAITLANLGQAYSDLGEYKNALSYHLQALEMVKRVHGDTPHPSVAATLANLGQAYSDLGEYKNALSYHLQALEMFKRVHGNASHPEVAATLTSLGKAYNYLGEYKNALSYHLQALEMVKRVHGDTPHPSVAATLANLGQAYSDLGEYKNALSYHLQALEMFKRVFGDDPHPSVAITLANLGQAYSNLGEYKNALSYYLQALKMYKRVPGNASHPEVAANLANLGQAYSNLGEYKNALSYHLQALEMYKRIHGDAPHPEVPITLYNLGQAYSKLGEYKNALSYYLQALDMEKRIHGDEPHPEVAITLNNLGLIYSKLGEYKNALSYFLQALEMYKRIHGDTPHLGCQKLQTFSLNNCSWFSSKNLLSIFPNA